MNHLRLLSGQKRAKRFAMILNVLLIAALLHGCGYNGHDANPSGTLEATSVTISPVVNGRILEIRVDEGDRVSVGDTLVVLDMDLVTLQRAQTASNILTINAQRLVAEDGLATAERNLSHLELSLERATTLLEQGSATQQQVDDLTAQRDVASRQVMSARHQLDALDAEEQKLQAALNVYDRQLVEGTLVSPVNGTVLIRFKEPGEIAVAGGAILRIADLSEMELRVYFDEQDLDMVQLGQTVQVLVDALEDETINGRVTWISEEAEFTPKSIQTREARSTLVYAVKINVPNGNGRLHIGMPAEIIINH